MCFPKYLRYSLLLIIFKFILLGGRIYIGIADKNNSVNGINLTQKQRDDLRL